jgi:NAD+ synthase
MKIKLIQENPVVGDILGNLAKAKEEIEIAKKNNVNLIIFSEMFLCGYPPEDLGFKIRLY